jgi:hypothetical protein
MLSAYKTRTCKNMSVACYYTNLTNALLIPQRIERRSHPYQKCALPIKLRNLYILKNFIILRQEHPDLNWKFEV